jgi:hypothetical protein
MNREQVGRQVWSSPREKAWSDGFVRYIYAQRLYSSEAAVSLLEIESRVRQINVPVMWAIRQEVGTWLAS